MNEDAELLCRYASEHSESAFAELIRRHVDLVYSAALRLAHGDTHRAEDVSQQVFSELARQAQHLTNHPALAGWLYTTTRRMAMHANRTQQRWQSREQEANAMNELLDPPAAGPEWNDLRSVLDEAMHKLGEQDRLAVLLRYFQNKSLKDVGAALGLSENAARMRVDRALEKLRAQLAHKGVTSTASALVVILAGNATAAAPSAFVATLTCTAFASAAAASGSTLTLLKTMTATKLKLGVVGAVIVAGVLIVLHLQRSENDSAGQDGLPMPAAAREAMDLVLARRAASKTVRNPSRRESDTPPVATSEEIVASRLAQFGRSRRELAHALAHRYGVEVPDAVKLFFDAVEGGNWDEIEARFKVLNGGDSSAGHGAERPPGVNELWCAIIDAYGVAEQTHLWPAQQLLDYGNAILGSLRPEMVYVGGTDNGRWIPAMLNDTSDGERHIVVTQNGLADGMYLDYINELYADRMVTLTLQDSRRIFEEYVADAQKRLQHDEQFPDEPKQVRPGENITMEEGQVKVSGQVAVMAINEKILQALIEKNPDLSFAVQESFPMKATYADALPLGPLMELRAQNEETSFTAERAAQSVDYWNTTAQGVLTDPEAAGSATTLKSYSHDANATANLLAAHNYIAEAEQAYHLSSQLWPGNPEPVGGLAAILASAGRSDEARQMLDDFARNHPDQRSAIETFRGSILWTATAPPVEPSP